MITGIFECENWLPGGIVLKVSHFSGNSQGYIVNKTERQIVLKAGSELTSNCLDIYQIGFQSYVRFHYEVAKQ